MAFEIGLPLLFTKIVMERWISSFQVYIKEVEVRRKRLANFEQMDSFP